MDQAPAPGLFFGHLPSKALRGTLLEEKSGLGFLSRVLGGSGSHDKVRSIILLTSMSMLVVTAAVSYGTTE